MVCLDALLANVEEDVVNVRKLKNIKIKMGCLFMKSDSEIILKISALTKSVQLEDKALELLQPIDLTVNSGETLAIVGSSGSGKTTLLSILAGLDLQLRVKSILKTTHCTNLMKSNVVKYVLITWVLFFNNFY